MVILEWTIWARQKPVEGLKYATTMYGFPFSDQGRGPLHIHEKHHALLVSHWVMES